MTCSPAAWLIAQEARALLTRLARVKPFALHETMVLAAAPHPAAQAAIEDYLAGGRRDLRQQIREFLRWLGSDMGRRAPPPELQHRFTLLRMRFNAVLAQFDIYADAVTQRSEHETGVWLAGLDALARDALIIPGALEDVPPLICYLDRGHGAAIRRARTRLPGGGWSPVAVIRVPRERMVGSGIASSLVHEVGHQAAELLGLARSLRPLLDALRRKGGPEAIAWALFDRWLNEILADLFSVARVGVTATLGLIGVVSLPRSFVFRTDLADPHPTPWLRVKLSAAMGDGFYPHPQWRALARLWECYYPRHLAPRSLDPLLSRVESIIPAFLELLLEHRPPALRGRSIRQVLASAERRPEQLAGRLTTWLAPRGGAAAPTLAFAMLGQARIDGRLSPEGEGQLAARLLTLWALDSALASERTIRNATDGSLCECRSALRPDSGRRTR